MYLFVQALMKACPAAFLSPETMRELQVVTSEVTQEDSAVTQEASVVTQEASEVVTSV